METMETRMLITAIVGCSGLLTAWGVLMLLLRGAEKMSWRVAGTVMLPYMVAAGLLCAAPLVAGVLLVAQY